MVTVVLVIARVPDTKPVVLRCAPLVVALMALIVTVQEELAGMLAPEKFKDVEPLASAGENAGIPPHVLVTTGGGAAL